ncbi:MAG: glycine C-acetyltransferase [Acidimicrobiia bacterium]|jgi:glycine C-acetyltransferase
MSRQRFLERVHDELDELRSEGLYKSERTLVSPQGGTVTVAGGQQVLNFCANNYLGLADDDRLKNAAAEAMERYGYGMASVRFICGTTELHAELEAKTAAFLGTEASITFAACFDANGAVFEPLLGERDAIVSDTLNHASIIDGIRLSKAARYRYRTRDLDDLDRVVGEAVGNGAETVMIATDGVFSMDGFIADLSGICEVADRHDALVMVDDCHATGFVGPGGRGTPALHGVVDRIDVLTGTFGKALGGGMGGFIAARSGIVELMRQRARPYLFSNALAPGLVGGAIAGLRLVEQADDRRAQLHRNAQRFREGMTAAGFELGGAGHPIIPVMIGDASTAVELADRLLELGIYVIAFSYPVVPKGNARIRTQMNAAHSDDDIDRTIAAFAAVGSEMGLVA